MVPPITAPPPLHLLLPISSPPPPLYPLPPTPYSIPTFYPTTPSPTTPHSLLHPHPHPLTPSPTTHHSLLHLHLPPPHPLTQHSTPIPHPCPSLAHHCLSSSLSQKWSTSGQNNVKPQSGKQVPFSRCHQGPNLFLLPAQTPKKILISCGSLSRSSESQRERYLHSCWEGYRDWVTHRESTEMSSEECSQRRCSNTLPQMWRQVSPNTAVVAQRAVHGDCSWRWVVFH